MKILLVDDDPVARSIHSMLLHAQGHEVVEAADGEFAWQLVEKGQIAFVVSDWMMPNLAGVDLCLGQRQRRGKQSVRRFQGRNRFVFAIDDDRREFAIHRTPMHNQPASRQI